MGGIVKGIFGGGDAATEAAAAQERAATGATAEQRRQFDIMQAQAEPYRQAGLTALNMQLALMGLPQIGGMAAAPAAPSPATALGGSGLARRVYGNRLIQGQPAAQAQATAPAQPTGFQTPTFTREQALERLYESPGQAFIRQQQEQGLMRQAAAMGGLGGGEVRRALQSQAAGFASQDLQNQLARLSGLSGAGQAVTGQLGQAGMNMAGNIGQQMMQAGQARASGILGQQQARQQLGGQLLGAGVGAGLGAMGLMGSSVGAGGGALLGLLSDARVKEDINELDLKACFEAVTEMPLMSWRYLEEVGLDTEVHIGPLAQEAPDMIRLEDMNGMQMLSLHDELMMIAGAIQYMKNQGMLKWH